MKTGEMTRRYRPQCLVTVDDYRLLIGTPQEIAAVRKQIQRRSAAAKVGWAKRRAIAMETGTAIDSEAGVVAKP